MQRTGNMDSVGDVSVVSKVPVLRDSSNVY